MPLRLPTPGGDSHRGRRPPRSILSHHKKKRKQKGRKHKLHKAKVHKVKQPARHVFHEQAGAGSIGGDSGAGSLPFAATDSGAGAAASPGAARALLELTGLDGAAAEGLMGAVLDLVGEGAITAAHALAAWTHEQDRLANRAWRRPGGMARMGGL